MNELLMSEHLTVIAANGPANGRRRRQSRRRLAVDRLRALRTDRRWTQRELAERAGISKEAIHVYERGRKCPHQSTLRLLAAALGVSADEILAAA
jgi:DNA-binding XRE family transcriptional regulator